MSTGSPKRKRVDRATALHLPPGSIDKMLDLLRRRDVLARLGACLGAIAVLLLITQAWRPPFRYRSGDVPARSVVARIDFAVEDTAATAELREQARKSVAFIYENDPQPLMEMLAALKGKVFQVLAAASFTDLDPTVKEEFFNRAPPDDPAMIDDYREDLFQNFRLALEDDPDLKQFEAGLHRALAEHLQNGLLTELEHTQEEGTLLQIRVRPAGNDKAVPRLIETDKVRIAKIIPQLEEQLKEELQSPQIAEPVFYWLKSRLPVTLSINREATERDREAAAAQVPVQLKRFTKGETILAAGGLPLNYPGGTPEEQKKSEEAYKRLYAEYQARIADMGASTVIANTAASLGMYVALVILCGAYIHFRQPRLLADWRRYATLLGFVVVTLALATWMKVDALQAESIPLVLLAMIGAIAYRQEVALLLSGAVALIFTISSGQGLAQFTMLLATMAASILLLGRIRSRTRLLYVGLAAAGVALATSLGVGMLTGENVGVISMRELPVELPVLLVDSLWLAACTVFAGLVMTGLLPFVEFGFDVQTDLSLLELGDAAHPLLQELVRRAPGTYNHSINVASISEAAADAIGANGLLCRVGAYFHDIGKMLKPGYFVENQSHGDNRHESLVPAMSTLVIIAHVKDGADLARQHGLPQTVIDFIQQHHGTTLVEYFYRQASQQSEANPDAAEVEESDFRYPGPKPQTREAAVMMLADAVESASRTLVEPTPSRIRDLVEEIAMKRLLDGQFDESNLTLSELHTIEESLVKSMTAVYHGRVKYPNQQTA